MGELEKCVAECEALKCELAHLADQYHKTLLEYEELQKRCAELEKQIEFYKGQTEAYQYCIDAIGVS